MNIIEKLKDAKIEKIIAGGSNGSIVLIDLAKGTDKYVLYIYCTWRLSFIDKVLTGWNDIDTVFVTELNKLENDIITEVILNSLGDFTLLFQSGIKLDVFCDITSNINDTSMDENWSFCDISKNQCYNFTNQFSFLIEPYDGNK
jgi:hypothetical protein